MRRSRTWLTRLRRDDRGTTLAEVLVGMVVMGIFMTIFTGAVISMVKTTAEVEAVTSSTAQVNNAFLKLDTIVRYSTAITAVQGEGDSDWFVELEDGRPTARTCTQLWLDATSRTLKRRTWRPVDATSWVSDSLSVWTTLASNVERKDAEGTVPNDPFTLAPAGSSTSTSTSSTPTSPSPSPRFQQLTITLVSSDPVGRSRPTGAKLTFTALNSRASEAKINEDKCQQDVGRP